jgi:hypothetical protein
LKPVQSQGLLGISAATGSILFINNPIEATLNHVVNKLPNDQNLNIIVEGSYKRRFKKGIVCSIPKVYSLYKILISLFRC